MSPFPLEPPYTRGGMGYGPQPTALLEGPLLARSRGMSRWHRVKSGRRWPDRDTPSYDFWCGQGHGGVDLIGRDILPTDGLPICGPCEGRALGAGYNGTAAIIAGEALLLFEPESSTKYRTPQVCPGSKSVDLILEPHVQSDYRVKKCGACGLHVALGNAGGSRYYATPPRLKNHRPLSLPTPCAFHAWDRLILVAEQPVCDCTLLREGGAA